MTDRIKRKEFLHYMHCGHGRCFQFLQSAQDRELFRDLVLDGCLHPFAFDLQCEGSRGEFMYRLASVYQDFDYFLQPVTEKFLHPDTNDNWHLLTHMCDFIAASDDPAYFQILEQKYQDLYQQIMTIRWSAHANEIVQCYEYLSIVVMQGSEFDRTIRIFQDIGAYFLRRRRADPKNLFWLFGWFLNCAEEKFGENLLSDLFASEKSKEMRCFVRIMHRKQEFIGKLADKPKFSADEFQQKADAGQISRRDVAIFRRSDPDQTEHLRLAERFIEEKDPNKKANLLQAFTISRCGFPLNPDILAECAESEYLALRDTATEALLYVHSEKAHALAIRHLKREYSQLFLQLLIHHYQPDDKELVLNCLRNLQIDFENESGWHNIVMEILENRKILPDEVILFVYEKSMCSCCRETAVSEMIRRNLITEQILEECLQDCNSDIRELAENFRTSQSVSYQSF